MLLQEQTEPTLEKEWREREKTSPRGWRGGGWDQSPWQRVSGQAAAASSPQQPGVLGAEPGPWEN